MPGRQTPGYTGLLSIFTFTDVLYASFSIAFGSLVMILALWAHPYIDRSVVLLLGTIFGHIPFVFIFVLDGIDPEWNPHSLNPRL